MAEPTPGGDASPLRRAAVTDIAASGSAPAVRPAARPDDGRAPEPEPAAEPAVPRRAREAGATASGDVLREALKPALALLANVAVVTALLVYFGWRRAETQAGRLGIDESVLGMTTREYVLRSVGPVLVLLVGIAVGGLAWMAIERRMTPALASGDVGEGHGAPVPRRVRLAVPALGLAWFVLPGLVYLLGFVAPALAFVLFPASIGTGVLLWVYSARLRRAGARAGAGGRAGGGAGDPGDEAVPRLALVFAGLLVLVCLFWTASNYAEVLGRRLADDVIRDVGSLPGVRVLSERPLFLDGPGVEEERLAPPDGGSAEEGVLRYRYTGLRLLESTGGRYFLVSDGWTPADGSVVVLADDGTIRLDFVGGG